MPSLNSPPAHVPPTGRGAIIAVVGCDGSGKSTLTGDLLNRIGQERETELIYLGQGSGNMLIWILGIPLIGQPLGRYLKNRSKKAHDKEDKASSQDATTALVMYLLSRWRNHKFKRMIKRSRSGTTIIADRYPQAEVPGFYHDGTGLAITPEARGFVSWLAKRELRLYQKMAEHLPDLLIRLNVDAETAHARKPDHKLAMLEDKVRVIPTLTFNGANILDLDGTAPYAQVLETALTAARSVFAEQEKKAQNV
jgi:thymidylate kinase